MKQVNTFSGRSFPIQDENVRRLKDLISSGEKTIIELADGTLLNVSAIESVTEMETAPYYMGNKMSKNRTRVLVDGVWKDFAGKQSDIEERQILVDPTTKYLT